MKKLIGVYDLQNNEQCKGIYDTFEEVSKCLGITTQAIYNAMHRKQYNDDGNLIVKGHEIVIMNEEDVKKEDLIYLCLEIDYDYKTNDYNVKGVIFKSYDKELATDYAQDSNKDILLCEAFEDGNITEDIGLFLKDGSND